MKKLLFLLTCLFLTITSTTSLTAQVKHKIDLPHHKNNYQTHKVLNKSASRSSTPLYINYAVGIDDLSYVWQHRFQESTTDTIITFCGLSIDEFVGFTDLTDPEGTFYNEPGVVNTFTIDSIYLDITHENNSGLNDTLIMQIVSLLGDTLPNGNVLWQDKLITNTTLSPGGNWLGSNARYNLKFAVGQTFNQKVGIIFKYIDHSEIDSLGVIASSIDNGLGGTNEQAPYKTSWVRQPFLAPEIKRNAYVGYGVPQGIQGWFEAQNWAFTVKVEYETNFTVIATSDKYLNTLCLGDSSYIGISSIGGTQPITYTYSPAGSIINNYAKPTSTTTYTITATDANGQTASASITLYVSESCTWPGDANDDGLVNTDDVLQIAFAYGLSGTQRLQPYTVDWDAYPALNWNNPVNAVDAHHADCDGNGIVSIEDTLAISLNYGNQHSFRLDEAFDNRNNNPELYLLFPSELLANQTYQVPIILGTADNPINDLKGLRFNIQYPSEYIIPQSVSTTFNQNWIGTNNNTLSFKKNIAVANRIDHAIARYSGVASGYGQIGTLTFKVKPLSGNGSQIPFSITNVLAVNQTAAPLEIDYGVQTVNFIATTASSMTDNTMIVYPNPANNFIVLQHAPQANVSFYREDGVMVKNFAISANGVLDISELNSGIYFLRVNNSNQVNWFKLIKR